MRKITKLTCKMFELGRKLAMGNTFTDGKGLYLHKHMIAEIVDGKLFIDSCGWNTNTTRERLNGLRGVRVSTKLGQMFLNGKEWDGARVEVSRHVKTTDCPVCGASFKNGTCVECDELVASL